MRQYGKLGVMRVKWVYSLGLRAAMETYTVGFIAGKLARLGGPDRVQLPAQSQMALSSAVPASLRFTKEWGWRRI